MFETKAGVLLIGGLGFFGFAFLSNAVVPILMYKDLPEQTAEQVVNDRVLYQFHNLKERYPDQFDKYFALESVRDELAGYDANGDGRLSGEELPRQHASLLPLADADGDQHLAGDELERAASIVRCAQALRLGRQVYIGEGCWHCHSQFVRPVSNESKRWGEVSRTWEYQNELQRPVMFGTRRVGPDLSREGGRRGNDWHTVHFFQPQVVSPNSPMPPYPWLFDAGQDGVKTPDLPNQRGLALITYIQWLGSWLDSYPYYEELQDLEAEAY
ncbi:MAG: cbb3-type cytochrome c oxidase subunit II [Pirellulaceae bacterium]|nr:cbb3-type cytochrome c oxidase subunit II [Pirellulaceae bacterium]